MRLKPIKILITGRAGFIGSWLARACLQAGQRVVVVDNLARGQRQQLPEKVTFYQVDICDLAALRQVVLRERPDILSHQPSGCAGDGVAHQPGDRFLVNSFAWFDSTFVPSAGGSWISVLADRATIFIPNAINDGDVVSQWIRSQPVQYIYLGRRGGILKASFFEHHQNGTRWSTMPIGYGYFE